MPHLPAQLVFAALALGVLVALGGGFAIGLWFAPYWRRYRLRKALREVQRVLEFSLADLAAAEQSCRMLLHNSLDEKQFSQLQRQQSRLFEVLATIEATVRSELSPAAEAPAGGGEIAWQMSPPYGGGNFPGPAAFKENLALLAEQASQTGQAGGLLMLSIDRFPQLQQRFGAEGAEALFEDFARLTLRHIRDRDVVCQLESDVLAVLFPQTTTDEGVSLADAIRRRIREHLFRVDALDCEVLVTASLSYTVVGPGCDPQLVLNQAKAALLRSTRLGRNKLHLSSGDLAESCRAI